MKTAILLSALLFIQSTAQAQGLAPVSADARLIAMYLTKPAAREQIRYVQKGSQVRDIIESHRASGLMLNIFYTFPWGKPASGERGMGFLNVDHKTGEFNASYLVAWSQCACGDTDERDPLGENERLLDSDANRVAQALLRPEVEKCLQKINSNPAGKAILVDIQKLDYNDVDHLHFSFDTGAMTVTRSFVLGANGKGEFAYEVSCGK